MKYRHIRSMKNALDAAKPLVLHSPEALDSNPMLLNTPGGTYYLPKGLEGWKPTDPADLLTKVTAVVPSDEGKDLWDDALQLFFCGDQSLIDYTVYNNWFKTPYSPSTQTATTTSKTS